MNWPTAFVLTAAIELPLAVLCAPAGARRRIAVDSLFANLTTHPLAWFLYGHGLVWWWAVELGVAVTEAVVYRGVTRLSWPRAVGASGLANGITAALSFFV